MNTAREKWKEIIILGGIVLLGFFLRSYNMNSPAIGYHNMKENDYLSMAQEMERTEDYVNRRIYFWNAFEDNPVMKVYPQPPLISYQVLLSWKLFGDNLWGPRLFNVIFGALSILVTYFIALVLFANVTVALSCAFLLAIMPLAVFFSRNIQPESPAFFFMLLGNLFYLRFAASLKKYNLVFGGIAFSLAWLYKFSFLIGIVPLLCCLPFKALYARRREFLKYALACFLPYLVIVISILWLKRVGQWEFQDIGRVSPWEVFTRGYWQKNGMIIWRYLTAENFTFVFVFSSLPGIIIALFRRRGLLNRYTIGWFLAIIPYCMVFSDYINQHSYYQMPFLILVCVASVYAYFFLAQLIRKLIYKNLFVVIMIMMVGISAPFVYNAAKRMFGVVFLGVDVAGESLKEFTKPEDRVFLFTFPQGYAIARYARRYVGWVDNLEDFKRKEEKFSVRYACFYPIGRIVLLKVENPALFEYLKSNYHVKEVGLTEEPRELYYIILEKGNGPDVESFLESFSGQLRLRNIYNVFGRYIFFYSVRPAAEEPQVKNEK